MTTKQQVEDLATEVRSYITDVKADSQTLADKVAALEAGADNADADQLAALIAEVKDAHKALDATITAAPAAVTSGDTTDGTTGDTTGSSGG